GAMHACAHDGHTAIALAMASALQQASERLRGSVRFAFQPAEERVGGARRMIREGVLDEPAVDQAYGLHIWSETPVGQLMVQPGPIFAAATHFRIIIRGRGGHASAPHGTIDPIVVAEKRITGGDDMAYFLERVPGAYFLLGARPAGDVDVYPHHSPKFDFDEACIPLGIELGLRIIERATGSQLD